MNVSYIVYWYYISIIELIILRRHDLPLYYTISEIQFLSKKFLNFQIITMYIVFLKELFLLPEEPNGVFRKFRSFCKIG